jgi:enoyl-CoA hydratase/carnithine racemase
MSALPLAVRPDGVAVLTFDQPGSRANILTADLWAEFEASLDALATRTDVKGLVLASAKPGVFIAGADLNLLANAPGPNDPAVRGIIEQGLCVLEKLEALPFPTCAAIDGAALGGGLEVALACDCRVAGDNPKVRLGLPEVTLGLIPGWGGTQRLPRIIGMEKAADMLTTGRPLDAGDAAACGLVSQVVAAALLAESAAQQVLASDSATVRVRTTGPVFGAGVLDLTGLTGAAAEAVRVMVEGAALPLKQAIAVETEAFMRLAGSDESKRLIAAFFASRKK